MRVVSGLRKGHRLKSPNGMDVRPTEDRVKESLFNILGTISTDSQVLDLFAGSGGIGIEFLSRGAAKCIFVDKSINSIKTIHMNIEHTKFEEQSEIIKMDSLRFLDRAESRNLDFDYIYIDPPFEDIELFIKTLEKILKKDILNKDGLILVEHTKELDIEDIGLSLIDKRNYGSKYISFFKK